MRPGGGFTAGPHSEACRPCRRRRTARPSRPPPAPCRQLIFRFFRCETCAAKSRLRTVTPGRRCRRMPRRARAAPHPRAALRRQKPLRSRDVTTAFLSPLPPRAIPNSRQLAPGGRALAPVPGDCDGRRLARVVAVSRQPTGLDPVGNTGRRPGAPASVPPPPLCPSPAICLRTCRGRARVARRGPSRGGSAVPMLADIMRLEPDARGLSPPLPASFQPAGRLRMPAVPVHPGRSAACQPRLETPSPSSATPRHRRACLLSAASAKAPARAGAVPAPAPSPARTRHLRCAPPARRTPSPPSPVPACPGLGRSAGGPRSPAPAPRGAARPPSPRDACMRAAAHDPIGDPDRRGAVPQAPRGPRMRP